MVELTYKSRYKKHPDLEHRALDRAHPQPAIRPALVSHRKVCFSFAAYACTVIAHLSKCDVPITRGLSDEEFRQIQARFGFDFPPDLRSILQEGLPIGTGFPNWRSAPAKELLHMINLPARGLCKEVSRGTFWCKHWGERPDSCEDAARIARKALRAAPVLVPIYSHCYIPCFPKLSGNPILFIFQKDVFYCGYDLADFFGREVFLPVGTSPLTCFERQDEIGARYNRQENGVSPKKRSVMTAIQEDLAMESNPNAAAYSHNKGTLRIHAQRHDNLNCYQPSAISLASFRSDGRSHIQDENPLYPRDACCGRHHHGKTAYDEHGHGQNQHPGSHHHQHSHRRSEKEVKWDTLNKRLVAELQSAVVKEDEALSRKSMCEERSRDADCCPPLKNPVRSAGNSPRMGQSIMSRYAYFHDRALPTKLLSQLTIAAPPWAAKMARHIPMWSDLAENKENKENNLCDDVVPVPDAEKRQRWPKNVQKSNNKSSNGLHDSTNGIQGCESLSNVDVVQSKGCTSLWQDVEANDRKRPECIAMAVANQGNQGMCKLNRGWLVPYFKDLERKLRRGGWREGEIEEMMTASLPEDDECFSLAETRQDIRDILSRGANVMSMSLQKAGWSVPDVVEFLS